VGGGIEKEVLSLHDGESRGPQIWLLNWWTPCEFLLIHEPHNVLGHGLNF